MVPLPIAEQLDIINNCIQNIENDILCLGDDSIDGLCIYIDDLLRARGYNIHVGEYNRVHCYIPLFTRANAIEHAGAKAKGAYWWNFTYSGNLHRIEFLKWIKAELKQIIK